MSRSHSARRAGLRKKDAQVSLFPFLAVLICTMGALIVLLVVLVQQAKVNASQVADQRRREAAQISHEVQTQRQEQETYDWRLQVLQAQREEIGRQLAGERLRLSHVEDHYRRIREELESLLRQAEELERVVQGSAQNSDAVRAELAGLHQAIELARAKLDAARQQAAAPPRSFALITYEGPRGTRRRPIYIECLRDKVILQPEGVTLVDRDFDGPLGPGNPLDAALRATREHLARTGGVARHGEPYPLLIVRSQGPRSYAAARAALESWDEEFGYELIDDDLVLEYPPSDPVLKEAMQAAADEARRRQEILRASQPNRFGSDSIAGFQAMPHRGGFRAIGGAAEGEGEREFGGAGYRGGSRGQQSDSGASGVGGGFENSARDEHSAAEGGAADGAAAGQRRPGGASGGSQAIGDTLQVNTPFAATRGRDWALKDAARSATPYTRPINVQVFTDSLLLLPERGSAQQPVSVPMTGSTRSAIDPFVQHLWKRMEGWGLAGSNAYWKPLLRVEVSPDAEDRFTDFQQLMEGSGLLIERRSQ
jgi:hypothetical protein